jgi:hypothetical protein
MDAWSPGQQQVIERQQGRMAGTPMGKTLEYLWIFQVCWDLVDIL